MNPWLSRAQRIQQEGFISVHPLRKERVVTFLRWHLAWLFGLGLLAALPGCKREDNVTPPPNPNQMPMPGMQPPPLEEAGPHAAGKKVYNANGCARCHSMGNVPAGSPTGSPPVGGPPMGGGGPGGPPRGGPPKAKGPDLAKAGAKEGRTVDWFVAYVSNPKKEKADSKMPAFEKKINADDMRTLAEFLASLK
jgi:mono/diheme cytochrome c family protein